MPTRVPATRAIRAVVRGDVHGVGFRDAMVRRARELRVVGWVRHGENATVRVHAEGDCAAVGELVAFSRDGPPLARVAAVQIEPVALEGHEQFAIRGASAGAFVVHEHAATAHHFDLRLEVTGVMRSWAIPKGPSLDPAVKRLAVEVADHAKAHNNVEGTLDAGAVIVWDHGTYEQDGRGTWPPSTHSRPCRLCPPRREAVRRLRPAAHLAGRPGELAADQAPRSGRAFRLGHRRRAPPLGPQ